MNERRERKGSRAYFLGLIPFLAGGFVLVLVVLSIWKPFPPGAATGTAAPAQAVVGFIGRVPAAFLALIAAALGAHRFLAGGQPRLALNLLGALGVTAGLAILCGALVDGAGGAVGAATGGALRQVSPVLGVVAGLLLMAGSAWLIWLRELVPLPGGAELRRAFSRPGRERAADGVSAAEAEALVVPGPFETPRIGAPSTLSAAKVRPIPAEEPDDPDGTTPSDRAPEALARGQALQPQGSALEPPVADLAGTPAAEVGGPARPRSESTPAGPGGPASAPAQVGPLAQPLSGVPPLGLAGGAQALTRPPAPPRPSWERADQDPDEGPSGGVHEVGRGMEGSAEGIANTWRPARHRPLRSEAELEALELAELEERELAAAEEELEASVLEDELEEDLEAELEEEEDEEGEAEDEDELDDLVADLDEDEDDDEEEEDDDEEGEEEDDEEGEEEDEDAAWDDSDEDDDEEEEDGEALEEDAAALQDLEEEEAEEADEPEAATEEALEQPAAVLASDDVEAELQRLLAEEDARTQDAALSAQAVQTPTGKEGGDALQMELFEASADPPPPSVPASSSAASAVPADADPAGAILEPQPPPLSSRRKPVRTHAEAPAASAAPRPRADAPSQIVIDCGCLFLDRGRVAVSMLQKTFGLDFEQSCAVLDELQERGLVGPYLGGQRRDILLTRDQWLELVGQPSQASND